MRGFINVYTITAAVGFVKSGPQEIIKRDCPQEGQSLFPIRARPAPTADGIYPRRENGYNKGSPSAEVAELADA